MTSKRQLLIDTALQLFYENGVNSVGINKILKVSGIAKKTLYHHFNGKEALILAALSQRNNNFIRWLESHLKNSTTDQQLIENLFNALTTWFTNSAAELGDFRGCFFINTSAEFCDPSSQIAKYCQFHKRQVRAIIGKYLSSPNSQLLDALCLLKEGAITTAYVTNDLDAAQKCLWITAKL
ncbi:MAG: transcriptional regulator, TetR family [Osedax symbiont Rs1]|nr:MAG: transcriptional regulator, TetR family [Osedax symbiont Rs1]